MIFESLAQKCQPVGKSFKYAQHAPSECALDGVANRYNKKCYFVWIYAFGGFFCNIFLEIVVNISYLLRLNL